MKYVVVDDNKIPEDEILLYVCFNGKQWQYFNKKPVKDQSDLKRLEIENDTISEYVKARKVLYSDCKKLLER